MDQMWIDAAQRGDVDALNELLMDDQSLFEKIDDLPLSKTQLLVAVLARQTRFAKELAVLELTLSAKFDEDGLSPMHLASATGQVDLVREFLSLNPQLCRLQGRGNRTPLHCAVIAGNVEVINLLLDSHIKCLLEQTSQNETVFHLAVKNNHLDVFTILLEWLEWLHKVEVDSNATTLVGKNHCLEDVEAQPDKKEIKNKTCSSVFETGDLQDDKVIPEIPEKITGKKPLDWKDDEGNTVLHVAASNKNLQVIEVLLGNKTSASHVQVDVNALNINNLTALDIILQHPGGKEEKIEAILRSAGGVTSCEIISALTPVPATTSIPNWRAALRVLISKRKLHQQVLLFAILLAIVCFYLGLNPPGGVWQHDHRPDQNNSTMSLEPGTAVIGDKPYLFIPFMLLDIAGFLLSLHVIVHLTTGSPIRKLILISLSLLFGLYVVAIASIIPTHYLHLFLQMIKHTLVQFFITFLVYIFFFFAKLTWPHLSMHKADNVHDEESVDYNDFTPAEA